MSKKEKTVKSVLIALAPSLFGMGFNSAIVQGELVKGGLLIFCGLATAGLYEFLQSREINLKFASSVSADDVSDVVDSASGEAATQIKQRWDDSTDSENNTE